MVNRLIDKETSKPAPAELSADRNSDLRITGRECAIE